MDTVARLAAASTDHGPADARRRQRDGPSLDLRDHRWCRLLFEAGGGIVEGRLVVSKTGFVKSPGCDGRWLGGRGGAADCATDQVNGRHPQKPTDRQTYAPTYDGKPVAA